MKRITLCALRKEGSEICRDESILINISENKEIFSKNCQNRLTSFQSRIIITYCIIMFKIGF